MPASDQELRAMQDELATCVPLDPMTDEQLDRWLAESDYANQFMGT